MEDASSWCVSGRPSPRSEPSTERRERSLSPSFMGDSVILRYAKTILQYVIVSSEIGCPARDSCNYLFFIRLHVEPKAILCNAQWRVGKSYSSLRSRGTASAAGNPAAALERLRKRSRSSVMLGRSARARISASRKSERDIPAMAARALSLRCMLSGTLRILITRDMHPTYIHVRRISSAWVITNGLPALDGAEAG